MCYDAVLCFVHQCISDLSMYCDSTVLIGCSVCALGMLYTGRHCITIPLWVYVSLRLSLLYSIVLLLVSLTCIFSIQLLCTSSRQFVEEYVFDFVICTVSFVL